MTRAAPSTLRRRSVGLRGLAQLADGLADQAAVARVPEGPSLGVRRLPPLRQRRPSPVRARERRRTPRPHGAQDPREPPPARDPRVHDHARGDRARRDFSRRRRASAESAIAVRKRDVVGGLPVVVRDGRSCSVATAPVMAPSTAAIPRRCGPGRRSSSAARVARVGGPGGCRALVRRPFDLSSRVASASSHERTMPVWDLQRSIPPRLAGTRGRGASSGARRASAVDGRE